MRSKHTRPILPAPDGGAERFWSYVSIGAVDDCWPWTGGRWDKSRGYGTISWGVVPVRTHRVAYALFYGADPGHLLVRHRCDNPRCCNPRHLLLGTQKDNMVDASVRRRLGKTFGEAHHFASVTPQDVRDIRAAHAAGVSGRALGRKYGISHTAIRQIVHRRSWKHVA